MCNRVIDRLSSYGLDSILRHVRDMHGPYTQLLARLEYKDKREGFADEGSNRASRLVRNSSLVLLWMRDRDPLVGLGVRKEL